MFKRFFTLIAKYDWLLLAAVFALVAFGLAEIYSVALSTEAGDISFFEKQLIAVGAGAVLIVIMSMGNYRLIRNWTLVIYIASVLLLVGLLLFGTTVRGTTGWYTLFGFSIQPVEFAKIALILTLAKFYSEKARRRFGWREIGTSGLFAAVPIALVILQPDFGSASVLAGIWAVMAFFAGLRARHALILAAAVWCGAFVAWTFLLAEYQKNRILTFLDPGSDPLGSGYNIAQATIAIGSGRLFGRGLGFGSQSQLKFLPDTQTDFLFAVIAEELGFVGVLMILGAFFLLFSRMLAMARFSRDDYTSYLILGIAGVFALQFGVNIGMNLGLFPVTGIGLPFVSYGGSGMLMSLALVGILESISVRTSYR